MSGPENQVSREVNPLQILNHDLDLQVRSRLEDKKEVMLGYELPSFSDYIAARLTTDIMGIVEQEGFKSGIVAVAPPTQRNQLTQNADLAFNVAGIAKINQRNPIEVATEVADKVQSVDLVAEVKTIGPFVNLELDYQQFAPRVLAEVAKFGDKYGHYRDGEPQVVVIDYSSPNVAKNMTVAHLRSTIIGESLMKAQAAAGNIPFGINHIGDWGTQFGSIIYQYKKELAEKGDAFTEELEADPTATLMRIYRQFNEDKKENPEELSRESAEIFLKLEKGDPELLELWSKFREWSIRDFGPTYDRLRIQFDAIQGESFYEDRMDVVVTEGVDKGVLKYNDSGAVVFPSQPLKHPTNNNVNDKAMLDQDGNPRDEIIVKPNGGTVYLTRDLAAIRYRNKVLGANKILYVIGKEQETHCLELFNMAHQLGYIALGGAEHVSFGHLNIDGRKMKSRSGQVVLLKTLLDETVDSAKDQIINRQSEISEKAAQIPDEEIDDIATKVGVGTLIFDDLKQDRIKDIEFSFDATAKVEAGGASYIQYTDARLNRIVEIVGEPEEMVEMPPVLSGSEKRLIFDISQLPLVIKEVAKYNAPHKLASYLTSLCQDANIFYRDNPVNTADTEVERTFRLNLIMAARQAINNASDILHLELPRRM